MEHHIVKCEKPASECLAKNEHSFYFTRFLQHLFNQWLKNDGLKSRVCGPPTKSKITSGVSTWIGSMRNPHFGLPMFHPIASRNTMCFFMKNRSQYEKWPHWHHLELRNHSDMFSFCKGCATAINGPFVGAREWRHTTIWKLQLRQMICWVTMIQWFSEPAKEKPYSRMISNLYL